MENKRGNYLPYFGKVYIVNSQTMLLEPLIEGKKKKTKVYEKDIPPFIVENSPQEIVHNSCLYFLSTYEGRKFSTKTLTNIRHKPPIVIDPVTSVYFFSTHSDTNIQNHWLSLQHLRNYESYNKEKTFATLSGDVEVILPISKRSFNQQYLKGSQLFCKTQFNLEEIRQKTEPSYTVEKQADRLMVMEYLNRLERDFQ